MPATPTLPAIEERSAPALPTPAELPGADVVVYDGQCRFCTAQVTSLMRWGGGRLAFLSLHDPLARQMCPDLSHDDLMKQMYVIGRRGDRHGGAAALRYLSRRLPRLWWLAPLLHVPGSLPLWQWCYQRVAQRRYRLSGASDCADGSCAVHYGANRSERKDDAAS